MVRLSPATRKMPPVRSAMATKKIGDVLRYGISYRSCAQRRRGEGEVGTMKRRGVLRLYWCLYFIVRHFALKAIVEGIRIKFKFGTCRIGDYN